jgi:outer membrane lipoprotein-sorting protein
MKFLRTAPTSRLLATIAGVVIAIAIGTAIAVAAAGSGPVPKRERLAVALHSALNAPAVQGVSARISFTNGLIGSSDFQGTDPLLQGTPTGRLWLGDHRLRLELQSDNGDAQIVVNGNRFWISDPAQHTVYEGTLPSDQNSSAKDKKSQMAGSGIPTIATIQSYIDRLIKHVNVSGAIPGDIAGQPAYTVRISPRHDGGLLGSVQLAWDAVHGVPLRIAIYARNNPSPVLQLEVTDISYGSVPVSDFNITPPAGSKIVTIATPSQSGAAAHTARLKGKLRGRHEASGFAAVAHAVPFKLVAPSKLVGLPRQSVSLLNTGGTHGALVTYGQGLGGIVVIERPQSAKSAAAGQAQNQSSQDNGQPSFSLPTVSIHGATGQELVTALGTVLTFNRGGVGYTVLGSVPQVAAEAAARAL